MTRAPSKTVQMAFLRIGSYQGFLLSADAAMKVAALMQSALTCEEVFDYSDATRTYQVKDPVEVEFKLIRATQLNRTKKSTPDEPPNLLALPPQMRRLPR